MRGETRAMLLSSWHAARRRADVDGAIVLTVASCAGLLIEQAGGDAVRAQAGCPMEMERFWATVVDALRLVVSEERPRQLGEAGRT